MAREYHRRTDGLLEVLDDEKTRLEASNRIRTLTGRMVLSPGSEGGGHRNTRSSIGRAGVGIDLVAGAGFEPATFGL